VEKVIARKKQDMKVDFFNRNIKKFVLSLEKPTIAKVLRVLDLLEHFGHNLGMPHSKKIGVCLFELRVRGVQDVRFLYTFCKNFAIILHCFLKKS